LNLVDRLVVDTEEATSDIEVVPDEPTERLNLAIKNQKQVVPNEKDNPKPLLKTIKREMEYFEAVGV
jgi:hypothetical protein